MLAEARPTFQDVIDWSCLSLCEVSRRAGVSRRTLNDWTLGNCRPCYESSMEQLRRLSAVLGEGVWSACGFETEGERHRRERPELPLAQKRYRVTALRMGIRRLERVTAHLREELAEAEAELSAWGF